MHHFYVPVYTGYCIFKTDLDAHQEICTWLGTRSSLAPAKEIKDIPETGEIGGETSTPDIHRPRYTILWKHW